MFKKKISEVKCDHPTSTKDGFIEVSNFRGSYVYGSRATYHCNPGYILWGNSSRLCDSSGQWTGAAPQCRQISCGDPPMIPHSAVALLNGSTQWKSQAVYSCLPGYESPGETLLKVEPLQWTCQTGELYTFNKLLYWASPLYTARARAASFNSFNWCKCWTIQVLWGSGMSYHSLLHNWILLNESFRLRRFRRTLS